MSYWLIKKPDNTILSCAEAPNNWNQEEIKRAHPDASVVELSKSEYMLIKDDLAMYQYNGNKIVPKSKSEQLAIKQQRNDWARNHTLQGLREQIEELKKSNYK